MNLDGVARLEFDGQTRCSAALITDRHLLSAAHCFDEDGDGTFDVQPLFGFRAVFEGTGGEAVYDFTDGDVALPNNWAEESADIAVITLTDKVSESFPRYRLYGNRDEVGKQVIVVGYGASGSGAIGQAFSFDEKLAGLNRFEALGVSVPGDSFDLINEDDMLVYDFDSGLTDHNTLDAMGLPSDLGFGLDEVVSADGDSGGPLFVEGAISGVTSFGDWVDQSQEGTWGELSFNTRVSSLEQFILKSTDQLAVFVVPGDFDGDRQKTHADIDLLSAAARRGSSLGFDLNSDGAVDQQDRDFWLREIAHTLPGDADLNQAVEFADFLSLSSHFGGQGGWREGDFDGNGSIQFADFLSLSKNFGAQLSGSTVTVPETSVVNCQALLSLLLLVRWRRTRSS